MRAGKWRVLYDSPRGGALNMAVDEAILLLHSAGKVPPTLRLYGWEIPTVSIGYFQSMNREVELEKCRQLGVGYVRRITGGRAVLHENEVTYSVVISESSLGGGIIESYRLFGLALLEALRALGIEAQPVASKQGGTRRTRFSPACFDAPSLYELVVGGRKIIGSAQVRQRGVILQHGSIPIVHQIEKLFSVLKVPPGISKEELVERFRRRATSLEEAAGRSFDYDTVRRAVARGFTSLGISLEEDGLSQEEARLAQELARGKYESDDWNLMR